MAINCPNCGTKIETKECFNPLHHMGGLMGLSKFCEELIEASKKLENGDDDAWVEFKQKHPKHFEG